MRTLVLSQFPLEKGLVVSCWKGCCHHPASNTVQFHFLLYSAWNLTAQFPQRYSGFKFCKALSSPWCICSSVKTHLKTKESKCVYTPCLAPKPLFMCQFCRHSIFFVKDQSLKWQSHTCSWCWAALSGLQGPGSYTHSFSKVERWITNFNKKKPSSTFPICLSG